MGAIHRVLCRATLVAALVVPALAQESAEDPMVSVMRLGAPGEHHRHLARMVGDWKAAAKYWMAKGEPPVEGTGTMHTEPILGGRFLRSEYTGELAGLALHGFGLDGYDNLKQKHVGLWIDNMSSWMLTFEGTCSDDGNVVTTTSEFLDPATRQPTTMRSVVTVVDDGKMVFEAFVKTDADPEFVKSMEITYTK